MCHCYPFDIDKYENKKLRELENSSFYILLDPSRTYRKELDLLLEEGVLVMIRSLKKKKNIWTSIHLELIYIYYRKCTNI